MFKKVVILTFLLILLLCGAVYAQEAGVEASVDGILVSGAVVEDQLGYEGEYGDEWSMTWDGEMTQDVEYDYKLTPITLAPGVAGSIRGITPKFELTIPIKKTNGHKLGLRLGYWSSRGGANTGGNLSGMDGWYEETSEGYAGGDTRPYVTMWEEDFYSYAYERGEVWYYEQTSESWTLLGYGEEYWTEDAPPPPWREDEEPITPVTSWYGSNQFASSTLDLMADLSMVQTDKTNLSLLGGARYATWQYGLNQGVSGTFYSLEETYEFYDYANDDFLVKWKGSGWYDEYVLDATSNVSFTGIGPSVGLSGRTKLTDKVSLVGKFTYSQVPGVARFIGNLTDVDNWESAEEWESYFYPANGDEDDTIVSGDESMTTGTYSGEVPISDTASVSIGITELQLAIQFDLNNLSIALGYFGSVWNNVPLAPMFDYPNANWNISGRTTVSFDGLMLKLGIRF